MLTNALQDAEKARKAAASGSGLAIRRGQALQAPRDRRRREEIATICSVVIMRWASHRAWLDDERDSRRSGDQHDSRRGAWSSAVRKLIARACESAP